MMLYLCKLTLHDNVFFASREMGILYETEKYLHNWALSYALFESIHIPRPYRLTGDEAQCPGYLNPNREQNLLVLNKVGIYVFPALPIHWSYQVNTFKKSQATYYEKTKRLGDKGRDRNYPNYGRAKELAVGSQFRTYIVAPAKVPIRRWIRLGKWASKIRVDAVPIPRSSIRRASGDYISEHPLNPIDLPQSTRLLLYNRIVMPPVSLVSQAKLSGNYWEISKPSASAELPEWSDLQGLPERVCLPRGGGYGASSTRS